MSEQKCFADNNTNNETHSFQNRLKIAMERIGGFAALMRETGLSNSAISNYLKGRKPKIDIAIRIAEACKVDAAWLILGGNFNRSVEVIEHKNTNDDTILIPFVNVEASAGNGLISPEWHNAEMIPFSRDLAYQLLGSIPKSIFMMRVQGDSMSPTIHPKDILFVDYTPNRLTQGIYVMSAGELTLVKRLAAKDPLTFSIISDNPTYPSFDVPMKRACWGNANPDADLRIVGRVIKVLHDFD